MKKKFSKHWKGSKLPRKQRKYVANLPLHLKKKLVSVNLSKELRKKQGKRNVSVRKNDTVKIMRGKFKKKQGKVLEVKLKTGKIIVEGIQTKKMDGSKVNVSMRASNLQIVELDLSDKRRFGTRLAYASPGKEKKSATEKQDVKTDERENKVKGQKKKQNAS
ncbi:MAG: 50S ribosomal protein L24 [Nanoarchaeota archaeon]